MSVDDCIFVDLPRVEEKRGDLTYVEGKKHVPFDIKRVFFVYDIPAREVRGAHAHRTLEEMIICLSGSLDVVVFDGKERKVMHLDRPFRAVYLPPLIWSNIENFDKDTVYLVLASKIYDAADYIRNYNEFLSVMEGRKNEG